MALMKCPECGREISDKAKSCPQCGFRISSLKKREKRSIDKGKLLKRLLIIIPSVLVVLFAVYFFLSPVTFQWCCFHRIEAATCTNPETCKRCGKTWGVANDHIWKNASCIDPKTCVVCGITSGDPLGHSWKAATCTELKTCTVCGTTEGVFADHDWISATCTTPKKCKNCGVTEGNAKGHNWSPATCTVAKTCKSCGKKEGTALGHSIKDYICSRCGRSFISQSDVPNVLDITDMRYEMNSVGGVDWHMAFVNKSSTKTINYIYVTMEFYNAVGDILADDITRGKSKTLVYTGPLKSGKKSDITYWDACFYNSTFSGTVRLLKIEIMYSDGTTLVLDESIARYAVKAWR